MLPKPARIWLAVLAGAFFVAATATNVVAHHVVIAVFTGLAAACNFLFAALLLHLRRAPQARPPESS